MKLDAESVLEKGETSRLGKIFCVMLLSLCSFLGGCATSWRSELPNTLVGQKDKRPIYTVDCSVAWSDIGYCLEEGGRICGKAGYEIIDGDPNNLPDYDTWDFGLSDVPGLTRRMVIRCKRPLTAEEEARVKELEEEMPDGSRGPLSVYEGRDLSKWELD